MHDPLVALIATMLEQLPRLVVEPSRKKLTLSDGVIGVPTDVSLTIAVHGSFAFTGTVEELQLRLVTVVL